MNVTLPQDPSTPTGSVCVLCTSSFPGCVWEAEEEHIPCVASHKRETLHHSEFSLYCSAPILRWHLNSLLVWIINTYITSITPVNPKLDVFGSICPESNLSLVSLAATRMEQSFCRWKQTCVARKRKRMSPTFPTTIWCHLKPTSWNEERGADGQKFEECVLLNGAQLCSAVQSCSTQNAAYSRNLCFLFLPLVTGVPHQSLTWACQAKKNTTWDRVRCVYTTCGGPSVQRRMQTAGEALKLLFDPKSDQMHQFLRSEQPEGRSCINHDLYSISIIWPFTVTQDVFLYLSCFSALHLFSSRLLGDVTHLQRLLFSHSVCSLQVLPLPTVLPLWCFTPVGAQEAVTKLCLRCLFMVLFPPAFRKFLCLWNTSLKLLDNSCFYAGTCSWFFGVRVLLESSETNLHRVWWHVKLCYSKDQRIETSDGA